MNIRKTIKTMKMLKVILFTIAVISALACAIASILHYTNRFYGNPVTSAGWISSMIFLLITFLPTVTRRIKSKLHSVMNTGMIIFTALSLFFFLTHLWNFTTAPWNQNGLFDDAAWDVYFAKSYILAGKPFQAAVFIPGYSAAREVIFHYYIIFFFKLFGFNLLTFNMSLLILGFITFIFTCLLIQRIFNNYIVTVSSAVILNFFPLHFIHTFVGHRYAIATPLMVSSMYFLYTGFKGKSYFRIAVSSVLTGLCVSAAPMGKHYLLGLFAALFLFLIFNFHKSFTRINWNLTKLFAAGVVISSMPLIFYILYNKADYLANEGNYMSQFIAAFKNGGLQGLTPYYSRMVDCLFHNTWYRWFLPDFVLIPVPYYLILIPGFIISFIKKQYQFIALSLVPPLGAFIAGFSDYRVLHSCPFWVISMAFTINEIVKIKFSYKFRSKKPQRITRSMAYKIILTPVALFILLAGLIPCIKYIDEKATDPYSIHFFAQKDVAVARYLRDIVAGVPDPSPEFRYRELDKLKGIKEPGYDTLICQNLGYAIIHLFLYDYDDRSILSFSDQLPYNLLQENEIFNINKRAIDSYQKSKKDLKLIWEITDKTKRIADEFKKLNYLGGDEIVSSLHEGQSFSFYILNIKNDKIDEFKQKVKDIKI